MGRYNPVPKIALLRAGEGKRLAQYLLAVKSNSYVGYIIIFPYLPKNQIKVTTELL
jgi:hypothetical protein